MRDERPLFSDALGILVELSETDLTLDTDRGRLVVPLRDITHAKRVPARRRPIAREIIALERIASAGWPAPETGWIGEWQLRAASGWTGRANSALAIGDPGIPLADAIDAATAWYRERALPPRITTPLPASTSVAGVLRARGWTARPTVLVQTAPLAGIPAPPDGGPEVRLGSAPSEEWLRMVAGRKGSIPAAARTLLTGGGEVRFPEVYAQSRLIAVARGVVTGDWLGVSLIDVVPAARRQGLARLLVHRLAGWAAGLGATRCYLQVEEDNAAAVALYAQLGFATHHTYVTWDRTPA
jgi:GNAT superfamily N-acetyltransferase